MLTNKQRNIVRKSKNAKFYFIPDEVNLPRVTVCIAKSGDHYARGLALCSVKTIPDPIEGSFVAWKSAMRAFKEGVDTRPILRDEAIDVIKSLKSTLWLDDWDCRGQFDVLPANGIEKKLFKCLL